MQNIRGRDQVTPIDVLYDDVLLAIFDFYILISPEEDAWQSLVHVCRRWRCIVFGSPRRLNLRLVCTHKTPTRESLHVWPALPLIVKGTISSTSVDNIVDALGHSDRVCQIYFRLESECLSWDEALAAAIRMPFPALTHLVLDSDYVDETSLVIPDTFLGGSAPRLQSFSVYATPFPGLPNLLMSATNLVSLGIYEYFTYITPEAMVTCLSMLTRLDTLTLDFLCFQPRPQNRRLLPITRTFLPNLTCFRFEGPSEYLDYVVAKLDAPRLDNFSIKFPSQRNLDASHLVQFISRTPIFKESNEVLVPCVIGPVVQLGRLHVKLLCERQDQLLSTIAQICAKCLPPFLTMENLRLGIFPEDLYSKGSKWGLNDVNHWLEILRLFTAVKNLYLSNELQPYMASVLQELVGYRTTEVLPSLQNIFLARFELSSQFQGAIGQFLTARQLSGHPVAVLPL